MSTNSSGAAPTGTVQFYRGSTVIPGTVAYNGVAGTSGAGAYLQATLTTTLSSSFAPVVEMRRRPELPKGIVLWMLVWGLVVFLVLLARIQPARGRVCASAALFLFGVAATSITGCGGAGNSNKMANITAKYSGDTNYKNSTSSVVTITIR